MNAYTYILEKHVENSMISWPKNFTSTIKTQ